MSLVRRFELDAQHVEMLQSDQRVKHLRHSSRASKSSIAGSNGPVVLRSADKPDIKDEDIVEFTKRVLCAQHVPRERTDGVQGTSLQSKSLDEVLPPLTSSNEVDVQLYAIIAVVLNQLVRSWYNRITPDDEFINEIVKIIAHCTRGIEQRLRHVDLDELLLDELPALMIAHIDGIVPYTRNLTSLPLLT